VLLAVFMLVVVSLPMSRAIVLISQRPCFNSLLAEGFGCSHGWESQPECTSRNGNGGRAKPHTDML
jgi:hypothetical protein